MNYIVETKHLTKRYKNDYAVGDVELKIPKGSVYGFLGPNGAGKTTTLRMLLGLIQPTQGEVFLFGQNIKKKRESILSQVGSLIENPSYYGHLNAVENLDIYRTILKAPKSKIREVLDIVGLTGAEKKKVKKYSLGMKQRLGIAIALLGDPKLLILDEPTNGLDPQGIQEIRSLIMKLAREREITVLLSSHLLSEIDQMADYVGIISKGKLIFQDRIELLRNRAKPEIQMNVNKLEQAWKVVMAMGIQSEQKDDVLVIRQTDDKTISHIVEKLVQNGIEIYRIEEIKKSLEDIFLDVVKEDPTHAQDIVNR